MSRQAHIVGKVEYREGDGQPIVIREGPVEVEETELDATLSWTDGETHGSAAMPLSDFRRCLAGKTIRFVEPAPSG